MLYGLWTKIVANSYVIGAGLLAVLAFFTRLQFLKNARDVAKVEADTMKAAAHAERVKRIIIKEEEKNLLRREEEIRKRLKKKGKIYEGIDNLTDSNDF